jgi:Na+/H+-translocating membrane pyrophosphatase
VEVTHSKAGLIVGLVLAGVVLLAIVLYFLIPEIIKEINRR